MGKYPPSSLRPAIINYGNWEAKGYKRKIHLKLKNLNELIRQVLCSTFINHLSLYTISLNHLIKGPPEDEIVILRSTVDDLIRGIHFSKLKPCPGPKKPPKHLSIPFKTNHSHSLRLQQITISEAGRTKNQLLELLSTIYKKWIKYHKHKFRNLSTLTPKIQRNTHSWTNKNTVWTKCKTAPYMPQMRA